GEIIPGYNGPIFRDDPVIVNTIRDILSARATAAANFIRDVIDNPDWARPLAKAADEGVDQLTKALKEANSGKPFRGGLDWESTGKWYDPDTGFLHKVWVS